MKVLVLYESKTGYTRRYAEWISEEVKGDLLTLKEATLGRVRAADLLIFGGNIRGSIISGQEKMMRLAQKAGGKKTFYFGVGMRPVTPRTLELLRKNNWIAENLFYFRGGLDQEALSPGDRTMLRVYQAMLKRRREIHPEDEQLLRDLRVPGDFSDREQIKPLLNAVADQGSL